MPDENIYERLAGSEMSFAEAQVRLARAHGMRPAAELGDFVGINAWPERAREYLRLFFAAPRPDDWETALFAEILVDAVWSLSESDSSELEGCKQSERIVACSTGRTGRKAPACTWSSWSSVHQRGAR
jgi:hypothetical protein